jgi:SET domain-containing protein
VPFYPPFRVGRAKTGLGLFATQPIRRGTWLLEYTGEMISDAEAARREDRGARYLFEINTRWTVDGYPRANIARYANHSCKPNMEVEIVRKRILLRTIRSIEPGDELTYNYGRDYLANYIPVCKCGHCIRTTRGKGRPTARKRVRRKKNGHAF